MIVMASYRLRTLYFSLAQLLSCSALAEGDPKQSELTAPSALPTLEVSSVAEEDAYVATHAASALKSDAPLFKTAQSISVVTREQIDQKQASTLADALQGVPSVMAGQRGRRGWDDLNIRGQSAGDQIFIDGLRMSANSVVAVELSGMEQIQVLKGPASVNFGQVQPGGLVNLVTKRPQAESFARGSLSYGSYNFKQGSLDLNYAPQHSEKGAFRLTGRVADQDDPIDYVYFKNFYIAPSYNVDLGEQAELSLLASYQHREYLRHQGVPVAGSVTSNLNGKIDSSLFSGDPAAGSYKADVYRVGWNFKYDFGDDLMFKHHAAIQKTLMEGRFTSLQGWSNASTQTTQRRRTERQDFQYLNYTLDNSLQKRFAVGRSRHELLLGLDALHERRDDDSYRCATYATLNVFNPSYYLGCTSSSGYVHRQQTLTTLQYVGVYLRDRIEMGEHWIINLAGRHDWAELEVYDVLNPDTPASVKRDQVFTGNASLMYSVNEVLSPYLSYATSFVPNTDLDANGGTFDAEEGLQYELGLKLQSPDQHLQGSLAWFDLTRKNVVTTDDNDNNVLRGKQRSKGIEAELSANLWQKLKLSAGYTYSYFAKITEDSDTANIGERLDNAPKHMYSLSARYYPTGQTLGWYVGAAINGMSSREIPDLPGVKIKGYHLYHAEAGYQAPKWSGQLSIRNLFDKEYIAGSINSSIVAYGNPRQINLSVHYQF
jgi:iron complex outermembrane receptor protein